MATVQEPHQVTKKNQKSRNGCLTCKKKRLKCDETKPACLNCTNKKIECGGYSTNFRWKSFEETTTSQKMKKSTSVLLPKQSKPDLKVQDNEQQQKQKHKDQPQQPQRQDQRQDQHHDQHLDQALQEQQQAPEMSRSQSMPEQSVSGFHLALQQAALSIAGRSPEELARQTELMAQGKNPYGKLAGGEKRKGYVLDKPEVEQVEHEHKRRQTMSVLDQPVFSPGASSMGSPSLSTLVRAFTEFESINIPQTPSVIDPLSPTPRILELSRDSDSAIDDENVNRRSFNENSLVISHAPKRSLSIDSALSGSSIPQYRKELLSFSHSYSQAHSPISVSSQFTLPQHPLTIPQSIVPSSDFDKVFQAFDKYTCAIMSIKDGPTENPWRTLVWPLALQHSVLFKSLASMSLFHVARGDESLRTLGLTYMRQSMNELAEGLVQQSIPNDVALATCISLAITDTWEKQTTTGIAHLKGARSIINKLDRQTIEQNEPLYKFLINVFLYYDVLARMSSLQGSDTDYDENGKLLQNLKRLRSSDSDTSGSPSNSNSGDQVSDVSKSVSPKSNATPNFNELFGSNIFPSSFKKDTHEDESIIDPLLGCAPGLFIIIGRVASFISKVRCMQKLSLSTVSTAVQLKTELASWKPDAHIKDTIQLEDPLCDVSSCIATAEAYRYSTLLYLQQAVPEIASQSSADLAEKVLMLLASIPTSSRTCVVHMFPLLVASCEMTSSEDREWVKDRWKMLASKMWIGTIDRSVDIVEEVWRRKDVLAARAKEQEPIEANETWELIQDRIDVLTRSRKRDDQGINSWAHWSTVMKEWKWEVHFG